MTAADGLATLAADTSTSAPIARRDGSAGYLPGDAPWEDWEVSALEAALRVDGRTGEGRYVYALKQRRSKPDIAEAAWRAGVAIAVGEWPLSMRLTATIAARRGEDAETIVRLCGFPSVGSAVGLLSKMGIYIRPKGHWTDFEEDVLLRSYARGEPVAEISSALPGRSTATVRVHASMIRKEMLEGESWRARDGIPDSDREGEIVAFLREPIRPVGRLALARRFCPEMVSRLEARGVLYSPYPGAVGLRLRPNRYRTAGYGDLKDSSVVERRIIDYAIQAEGKINRRGMESVNALAERLDAGIEWTKRQLFALGIDRCPVRHNWLGAFAWFAAEDDAVQRLAEAGCIVEDIASVVGRMPEDVADRMRGAGLAEIRDASDAVIAIPAKLPPVARKSRPRRAASLRRVWSAEMDARLLKAAAGGVTRAEACERLGAELGVSAEAIDSRSRRLGIRFEKPPVKKAREWEARLREAAASGETRAGACARLAAEFAVEPATIDRRFRTLGIHFGSSPRKWTPQMDELVRAAAQSGETRAPALARLASELGMSIGAIYVRARALGVTFGKKALAWTDEMDAALREAARSGETRAAACDRLARALNGRYSEIDFRFRVLGIRFPVSPRIWTPERDALLRRAAEGEEPKAAIVARLSAQTGLTPGSIIKRMGRLALRPGERSVQSAPIFWNEERDALLREAAANGERRRDACVRIAAQIGASRSAVDSRFHDLGIRIQRPRIVWTPERDEMLRAAAASGERRRRARRRLAELFGIKPGSVESRFLELDIRFRRPRQALAARVPARFSWTPERDALLRAPHHGRETRNEAAVRLSGELGISQLSVRARLRKLGIKFGRGGTVWTKEKDALLCDAAARGEDRSTAIARIAKDLGLRPSAVSSRCYKLRIRFTRPRPAGKRKSGGKQRGVALTEEQLRTIVGRHREGWKVPRIARAVGCGISTVYAKLSEAGRSRASAAPPGRSGGRT